MDGWRQWRQGRERRWRLVRGDLIRGTVRRGEVNQWWTEVRTLSTGGLVFRREAEAGGRGGGVLRGQVDYFHALLVFEEGFLEIDFHLADWIVIIIDGDNLGYHS